MKRNRFLPWIHRWSRSLIAGIASVGAAITGYLAIVKLTPETLLPARPMAALWYFLAPMPQFLVYPLPYLDFLLTLA